MLGIVQSFIIGDIKQVPLCLVRLTQYNFDCLFDLNWVVEKMTKMGKKNSNKEIWWIWRQKRAEFYCLTPKDHNYSHAK